MKYFAMIEGERRGPFTLEQLPESGITPETYVWRKGLDDWQLAADDPDICRFYRQRIAGIMHPSFSPQTPPALPEDTTDRNGLTAEEEELLNQVPPAFRHAVRKSGILPEPSEPLEERHDFPPSTYMTLAIVCTLLCFPPTGFVAIYMSYKAMKLWKASGSIETADAKGDMQREAHEYARKSRMWLGITFFMGMITMALLMQIAG